MNNELISLIFYTFHILRVDMFSLHQELTKSTDQIFAKFYHLLMPITMKSK